MADLREGQRTRQKVLEDGLPGDEIVRRHGGTGSNAPDIRRTLSDRDLVRTHWADVRALSKASRTSVA